MSYTSLTTAEEAAKHLKEHIVGKNGTLYNTSLLSLQCDRNGLIAHVRQ
jgi:hypothetical protein